MGKEAIEKQKGSILDYTLTADVNAGDVIVLGGMIAIAVISGMSGEIISVETEKVWTIKAKEADVVTVGEKVYFDETNRELTTTEAGNTYAGRAVTSKGAVAGVVDVKINIP